eukprot:1819238-Amphidinium_carterae.1
MVLSRFGSVRVRLRCSGLLRSPNAHAAMRHHRVLPTADLMWQKLASCQTERALRYGQNQKVNAS